MSMQVTHKQVLGDRLYVLADDDMKKNPHKDRHKVVFEVFVKYILENKWTYQLRGRDPSELPIHYSDANKPLSANCFMLCELLQHTMNRFKLAVHPMLYLPIREKPDQEVVLKWNISPSMKFFDPNYQSMYNRWGDFALFSQHLVLCRSDGTAYDPTFMAMYYYCQPYESLNPKDPKIALACEEYRLLCLNEGL